VHGRLTLRGAAPPVGAYRLQASPLDEREEIPVPEIARHVIPSADGTFRIDALPPGRWYVAIERVERESRVDSFGELIAAMKPSLSWGIGKPRGEEVEVPAGNTAEVVWEIDAATASPGGEAATVSGRVTVDGVPGAGLEILARTETDTWSVYETQFAITATDGTFVRNDVARRPFELVVRDPNSPLLPLWSRRIDPSAGAAEVRVAITRATLNVRIVDAHGRPAAQHEVFVDGAHSDGGHFVAQALTDPAGRCTLPVFQGAADIRVRGSSGHAELAGRSLSGASTVELRLTTSGMFTGRVLSTPEFDAEWIGLAPMTEAGGWWSMWSLDDDGSFVISDLEPGRYRVTLQGSGETRAALPGEIEVGPDGRLGEILRVGALVER
jgi:hypothetical protein